MVDHSQVKCALSSERLFCSAHAHALVHDGIVRVRCTVDRPTELADEQTAHQAHDVVRWAGMRALDLDRPAFVKRWQRYVAALLELIRQCSDDPSATDARSERLALASNRLAHMALSRLEEVTLLECESAATGSACVALLMYGDDELTPYLYFLEDGLCGLSDGTRSGGSA